MMSNPKAALRAADNALDLLRELQEAVLRARALPSEENYADVRTLAQDALDLAEKAEDSAWNDIDPEEAAEEPELWEAHLSAKDAAEQARKGANDALALAQGEAPATAAAKRIALKKLGLETLEQRYSDELDFHEHAVWTIQAALEAAYAAGLTDGKTIH